MAIGDSLVAVATCEVPDCCWSITADTSNVTLGAIRLAFEGVPHVHLSACGAPGCSTCGKAV